MTKEIHVCTNRCNNDLDCDVCDHGVNIAQNDCELCADQALDTIEQNPGIFSQYFNREQLL